MTSKDLALLKHRGPDDEGLYNDAHVSLGHVRLSIIDLSSAGHQPMVSEDARYVLVYNGEVYNYIEIREQLRAAGIKFTTDSDTEVVLKAYIHWGAQCLSHFRGMFAFAIWDTADKTLFTARDRCGEKPFIYYMDDDYFYFASEFKALVPLLPSMPRLDPSVVDMYLHYQYPPEPFTLLQGVRKLPMAHFGTLQVKNWTYDMDEYWNVNAIKADPTITKEDIKKELEDAIRLTLRSDVDVGVALSAGIDSAGIAAIAAKHYEGALHTFCVGYPGKPNYDERDEARAIAEHIHCPFNEVELATDEFVSRFPDFVSVLDEPVADIAAFGHFAVPNACKERGIKVLLTGLGGDEVFWGYDRIRTAVSLNQNIGPYKRIAKLIAPLMRIKSLYTLLFKLSRTVKIPGFLRVFFRKTLACVDQVAPDDQFVYMAVTGAPEFTKKMQVGEGWYGPAMKNIGKDNAYIPTAIRPDIKKEDVPVAIMDLHFRTWQVSNCLSLGDRVSMAVGVETRIPLLDAKLIEKVVARRKSHPDHNDGQKALLREILADLLPEQTIKRRKSGFITPGRQWVLGIARQYAPALMDGHLVQQGIMKKESAASFQPNPDNPGKMNGLYAIILLEYWYDAMTKIYQAHHSG